MRLGATIAARTHRQRGDRQHVDRALRRHREAGQQRVEQRRQAAAPQRRALRRATQGKRRHPPPDEADEDAEQRRDHRHVQAGNRHQVGRPGAVEGRPQVAVDGALVAHRQRHQDAGPRVVGGRQHGGERGSHRVAQALDDVTGLPDHGVQALRRGRAHIAGRPDVAFEQPGLVVEAVRVGVAVRALQPDRQLPALAGTQRRAHEILAVAPPLVPGQHHPRRDHRGCGRHLFNGEFEAAALGELLRQCGDDADHLDIAPLPFGGQRVGKADLRPPASPGEAERGAGDDGQHAARPGAPPAQCRQRAGNPRRRPWPERPAVPAASAAR